MRGTDGLSAGESRRVKVRFFSEVDFDAALAFKAGSTE